jgi:hypothetical protein
MNAGRLQEMLAPERPLWRINERDQQRILPLGQSDRLSVCIGETPVFPVKLPIAEAAAAFFQIALSRGLSTFPAS